MSINCIDFKCQFFNPKIYSGSKYFLYLVVLRNVKWRNECCGCFRFLVVWKIDSYHSYMRGILTTYPIWYVVIGFVGRIIILLPISWMCLIWLNIHLFSLRLVLIISLFLRAVITCTLLHFPVICWLDMASKTCWTVDGYFLPIIRIQPLVLFPASNLLFHGLFFLLGDIWHVVMFTVLCHNANGISSWW